MLTTIFTAIPPLEVVNLRKNSKSPLIDIEIFLG